MKKKTFLLIILFISHFAFSQCANSIANPLSATDTDNSGEEQTIITNSETNEYVTISNIISGDNYRFKNTHSDGANEYITITDESNVVIVHGISPLTTNVITVPVIRMHISVDAICTEDLFFHTTSIQNLSKVTCNKPINPLISYLSNSRIDFNWSPPELSNPTGYDWEIVPAGNDQGVGVIASGSTLTTNTSTGEVLATSTAYTVYIRSDCGINGVSIWLKTPNVTTLSAPPPVNDYCSGAISIIQQTGKANAAAATPTAGTLLGGAGTDIASETCNSKIGDPRDDVWFSFLAQTTDVNITLESLSFNGILTLYSGDCNALGYLDCSDTNGGLAPREEEISYSGLIVGQTYYTRVYSQGFSTLTPTFDLKIWSSTPTTDVDGDGFSNHVDVDCNDNDASINPEAIELCDGIDNNCDGNIDEGIVCEVDLGLKSFLQGPYDTNTGLMLDDLRSTANIPTTSPYTDAKTCNVSVFNVTGNNAIVDWVWIEIRDGGDGTTIIASTSALIQTDGDIVNVDGVSGLTIDVPFGNYYVMISHRNHLGILTASTVILSGGVLSLDLTTNSALVEGNTNGIADMGDGSFALYAGDFNGDGQVQNSDKNAIEPLRGTSGYSNADIDMNSEVQNSDINSVLNPNIGKGEQFASRSLFAKRQANN